MKTLRLLLGAVLLLAGCESPDPVTPPPALRYDIWTDGSSTPCDSACLDGRSPVLGGGSN